METLPMISSSRSASKEKPTFMSTINTLTKFQGNLSILKKRVRILELTQRKQEAEMVRQLIALDKGDSSDSHKKNQKEELNSLKQSRLQDRDKRLITNKENRASLEYKVKAASQKLLDTNAQRYEVALSRRKTHEREILNHRNNNLNDKKKKRRKVLKEKQQATEKFNNFHATRISRITQNNDMDIEQMRQKLRSDEYQYKGIVRMEQELIQLNQRTQNLNRKLKSKLRTTYGSLDQTHSQKPKKKASYVHPLIRKVQKSLRYSELCS